MMYIKRLYTLFLAAAMALICFAPICGEIYGISSQPFSLYQICGVYILIIPLMIVLDTVFDSFLFFRFKFNFVFCELWCIILFYIYCRIAIYGYKPQNMTPVFYISFIFAAIAAALALSIRDCDNSGMSCIKKYDLVWITLFAAAGIFFVLRCIMLKNDPSSITNFDDAISRTFICPY